MCKLLSADTGKMADNQLIPFSGRYRCISKTDHTCHVMSPTLHLHAHGNYHSNTKAKFTCCKHAIKAFISKMKKKEFKSYLGSLVMALFNTSNMSFSFAFLSDHTSNCYTATNSVSLPRC